jgi:hypothetical protein
VQRQDTTQSSIDLNLSASPDRRSTERRPNHPCPRCRYMWITVFLRTTLNFHCRCEVCGETWAVLKPSAIHH